MATETSNRNHSATFPVELPMWFIKLFTQPGDVVLDPFVGSGTTALAAAQLGRYYVGIDISREYVAQARRRLSHAQMRLRGAAESMNPVTRMAQ
jgi:site-specific DNA-methyltransferase (adenine-specific)/site-specific DNA-methyltransferase (cytosine-N4-specific)